MALARLLSLLCLTALSTLVVVNADIVVFVHGIAGFGPDELLGLNYWGFGKIFPGQDYMGAVGSHGHTVFYASVGPVSSNWDRACELYAQIKGTQVDYGQAHSSSNGHARFGKDYRGRGFYPSWDGSHRIHFVGHSMGGNTIRMLEYLLQNGAPAEVAASGTNVSDLFKASKAGGNTWIQSMTTISTPHDGSTLYYKLGGGVVKFLKDLVGVFAGVMGLATNSEWLYNFDLDQFGLQRHAGESFSNYFNRIMASAVFDPNFKDFSSWDLSPDASRIFNSQTKLTYPNTYYFSVSTVQTHSCYYNDQCADIDIEPLMSTTAGLIGDIDGICDSTGYCFGNEWEANDGMVPVRSSKSPQNGISGYVEPADWASTSTFSKGRWYNRIVHRDHIQIVGFRINPLVFNAADGIYDVIGSTISAVRIPAGSGNLVGTAEAGMSQGDVAIVAGSVAGGVAAMVLVAVGIVSIRRRRHSARMVTAFTSNSPGNFSPRKFTKKQMERGSITLHTAVEADNPEFRMDIEANNPIFRTSSSGGEAPVISMIEPQATDRVAI